MSRPLPFARLAGWLLLVVAAAACSGSGGRAGSAPKEAGPIAFTLSGVDVQSARLPPPPLPEGVRAGVLSTLNRYLDTAVLGPLRSGRAAGDLTPVFTPAALARMAGPDRGALVDEGLPPAGDVRADAVTARLSALAGPDQAVAVVAAAVDLRLRTGGGDPVTIARTGDLVLVPDGDGWKLDGYDIRAARDNGGAATTTTARR